MFFYIEDDVPVFVEDLTLEQARYLLARTEGELPLAYNWAHRQALKLDVYELQGQIEWLESERAAQVTVEAAEDHAHDLYVDYVIGA
ncbi:hypothetical protein MAHJHV61_00380 [Mycobacterium avium subsp. hominissuis]|uniref:Uncharacterized protein n=3 Tax=Mycobacterium TaxID=1763 RepID=A0A1X1XXX9_9MYCO|nr:MULTISPECIES: hypothetical protein [Mycobacterium]MBZ4632851.1 hypothetical protein [Mycobacterium avium subsp. hominissuis]ORW03715.1 hypothetical protein AWC14_00295 [Mycobacterium kyorinense]ORW05705.1 hypothetical protein AWC14_26670 [Mycobacterium kyorinense]PBJ31914.1 hypothetical protein XV03_18875 [Mycobacterium avium subsp. hominissuis]PBJ34660.1 hypothetical protein XV03_11300 [Mycobacterium avium subsp. hominissuis]